MVTDDDVVFLTQRGMAFALNQETEAECLARTRVQIEEIVAREIEARAPEQGGPYSIEPHGDAWVLYAGRDSYHHGANLCRLSEFDAQGDETRKAIVRALNARAPEQGGEMREAAIAFVKGAKWWEYHATSGTMWQSDQALVADEAEKRYGYRPTSDDMIRALLAREEKAE